jgi:hypothetical protein
MTSKVLNKLGYLTAFVLIFSFWGCASDPVRADLPANHPANPMAAESAFTAASNPFKEARSMDEMKSTDAPPISSKGHKDSPTPKMKPMLDKGHMDHENSTGTETEKSGQQHQEHN